MALFHPAHSEEAALAPNLWLRTRALEAWLNDKARQGWSLAAMDGTDALLRQDGGGKRYRVVAHADAGLTAFLERCEAEGWRLAGSGEDVYILEDAAGTAKEIEDGATEAYVRRRCRRKALAWAGLAAFYLLLYAIMRLCGDGFDLMRSGVLGGLFFLVYPAMMLAAAAICLRRGARAIEGDVRQNVLRRWWQKNLLLSAAWIFLALVQSVVLAVHPLPPVYHNAPLPEAEAPYTIENVYGMEGEYSANETDGSFFVPGNVPWKDAPSVRGNGRLPLGVGGAARVRRLCRRRRNAPRPCRGVGRGRALPVRCLCRRQSPAARSGHFQ